MNKSTKKEEKQEKLFSAKYLVSLLLCAVITFLISFYVIGTAVVCGSSMQPTMNSGDLIIVNKLTKHYERYDIVIISLPDEIIIKRIIAVPGDSIQIKDGETYINDQLFDDVVSGKMSFAGIAHEKIVLGDNEYFVLGDNRENSKDSRYEEVGIITEDQIVGRAIFSLMPLGVIK